MPAQKGEQQAAAQPDKAGPAQPEHPQATQKVTGLQRRPFSDPNTVWKGRPYWDTLKTDYWLQTFVRHATRKNDWYYKDRCGVNRGPATVPTLREAWVHGLIDHNTQVWGQGLIDFLPIKNVRTLEGQIRTPEGVRKTPSC